MKNNDKQSTTNYRRVVVFGSEGQLGHDLVQCFSPDLEVLPLTHRDCDIADETVVRTKLEEFNPDLIINAAAYNSVEQAALNPEVAYHANAIGPYVIARTANALDVPFMHFSTDYVFDGDTEDGFIETDTPHPLNVYGASKRAGEELVAIATKKHWIVRTSALYGTHRGGGKGYNFVTMMLDKAQGGEAIRVVGDQWTVPTFSRDLALTAIAIAERAPFGIYHATNTGEATWYDFAEEIFRLSDLSPQLSRITTEESGTRIDRPHRSVLRNTAFAPLGISPMRPWKAALADYLKTLSPNKK